MPIITQIHTHKYMHMLITADTHIHMHMLTHTDTHTLSYTHIYIHVLTTTQTHTLLTYKSGGLVGKGLTLISAKCFF